MLKPTFDKVEHSYITFNKETFWKFELNQKYFFFNFCIFALKVMKFQTKICHKNTRVFNNYQTLLNF